MLSGLNKMIVDVTLNDQETVRNIRDCYLYALYTQMLTTRTSSDAKIVFRSLLQVRIFLITNDVMIY